MATGSNRKKPRWINPFKRLPVQSTTPQPFLQELCLTTSCSANSTRACGNILEMNYAKHWKIFPDPLPLLLLLQLKPIAHPACRRYKDTLCHSSLHQPCTYLATCLVSAQSPLQVTHISLSALPQWQGFYTSSHSLYTSLGFSQLSHTFPEMWKLSLSQDHRQVKWRGCPMSSAMCPSEQASQQNWVFAALGFCCSPKHHSPGYFSLWQKPGQLLFILHLRN